MKLFWRRVILMVSLTLAIRGGVNTYKPEHSVWWECVYGLSLAIFASVGIP